MKSLTKIHDLPFEIIELEEFLREATYNTYATQKVEARDSGKLGYKVLKYKSGKWEYRDKYIGFFRSFGSETILYDGKIVWQSHYGGGMLAKFVGNEKLAGETFEFLKACMRAKPKDANKFYLRGPEEFKKDDWKYECKILGDITAFHGGEKITKSGEGIFWHDFLGGVVVGKWLERVTWQAERSSN